MPQRRASGRPGPLTAAQAQALQGYADQDGDDRSSFWGRCNWYLATYGGLTPAQLAVLVDQMATDGINDPQAQTGRTGSGTGSGTGSPTGSPSYNPTPASLGSDTDPPADTVGGTPYDTTTTDY